MKVDESYTSRTCSLCGEAHEGGRVKRGLFKCPRIGKVINVDLNGAVNILHIPESLGSGSGGQLSVRDRGNGLKTQPVVYHWMNGAGWVNPTSYEVMRMKAVNHKPMTRPGGTLALQGEEEVRAPHSPDERLVVHFIIMGCASTSTKGSSRFAGHRTSRILCRRT